MSAGRELTLTPPIRPATPDDAALIHSSILKLGEHLGAAYKIKSTPDDLRRIGFGARSARSRAWSPRSLENSPACACISAASRPGIGRPGVYIQDLYVDERFRGMERRRAAAAAPSPR